MKKERMTIDKLKQLEITHQVVNVLDCVKYPTEIKTAWSWDLDILDGLGNYHVFGLMNSESKDFSFKVSAPNFSELFALLPAQIGDFVLYVSKFSVFYQNSDGVINDNCNVTDGKNIADALFKMYLTLKSKYLI